MNNENMQQEINSFKGVFVIKNFLSKADIRNVEQLSEVGEWNLSDRNNKQNSDGTFYKWMPLLDEYKKEFKTRDFQILLDLHLKINDLLNEQITKIINYKGFYLKNCGIFSSNIETPYYADNAYPVDSNGETIILGYPAAQGYSCIKNLEDIKEWKIREGFEDSRYSCALFLNEDVDGGGLVFPEHQIEIKPERNKLIIFPSTPDYIHGERPVIKGIKNCYCAWYGSKSADFND